MEVAWRSKELIVNIQSLLNKCNIESVEFIPRELNGVVDRITKNALKNPVVSLFHRGLVFPSWLVEATSVSDLSC